MRLIDAERLDVFAAKCPEGRDVYSFMDGVTAVLDEMDKLPAINLVQCKDCRWGKEACGNIECNVDSNLPSEYHGYEWFCPNGERKDDEQIR